MSRLASNLRFSVLAAVLGLAAPAFAAAPSAVPPAVDHYVYLSFLPKPSELAQDAKINGLTILRIDELSDRVIVSYQYPDGRNATLGYALLDAKPASQANPPVPVASEARPVAQSTARYVVSDRDPEVIYVAPTTTRVYYYNDPWYNYWAPLTVGFGVGWASGYYGSYYRPYYGYYGGGHHHHGGYKYGGHHGGYPRGGGYHSSGGHGRGGGGGGHGGGSRGGGGRGHR